MPFRYGFLILLVATFPLSIFAQSGPTCQEQARTPLEQVYCKIRAADPNVPLPSLQELRRNPEKTQRLLLRRPAQQAGVALPQEGATRSAPPKPAAAEPATKPTGGSPWVQPARVITPATVEKTLTDNASMAGCILHGTVIRCGAESFQLQGNLPNSRLVRDALDPNKKIAFAEYSGSTADHTAVMAYVSEAYRQYIDAMLEIGLGASTMSLTKFHHTFLDAQARGTRFGERMSEMFSFLKKDKLAMGVQSHYNDALPESVAQCMGLSESILVCDNVQQNWVYKRTGI